MWTGHTLRGGIDYRRSLIEGPSVKRTTSQNHMALSATFGHFSACLGW